MAILKAFKGIRPVTDKASLIASRPYDVLNKIEARAEAGKNELSFLRVIKPEITLDDSVGIYSDEVYQKGLSNFDQMMKGGHFQQDEKESLYVYAQTMYGRTQYGLVGCAGVEDYLKNVIKKHELTRPDKEEDRKKHVRTSELNYEPVFFSYPAVDEIDTIIGEVVKEKPEYDFTSDDDIGHHFWVIRDNEKITRLIELFKDLPSTYVADGHHRTAAAALVGEEKRKSNPEHNGTEEYNYFLAVHFPDNQLSIWDYNRVVKDLNGHSVSDFLKLIEKSFEVTEKGNEEYKPEAVHEISMYLDKKWYQLKAKGSTYNDSDPIGCLDVTILSNEILTPILDITDLRKSKRIDFVGGIRGISELKRRVDNGEMKVAFALYPVSMKQLITIADTGNIMPPKTTWFEPKLRSGLIIHSLK